MTIPRASLTSLAVVISLLLTIAFAGATAAATPGPGAAPQALGTPTLWGWVTARHPSRTTPYAPAARDHGSSITSPDGTVTVRRVTRGHYVVTFGGIAPVDNCPRDGCDGTAVVTALSTSQRFCAATDLSTGGPTDVDVVCTDRHKHLVDTIFTLDYVASYESFTTLAYLWASDKTSAHYDPEVAYNFNSAGPGHNEMTRLGKGSYRAWLPGVFAETAGNLQVAGEVAACHVTRRKDVAAPIASSYVFVHCRDFAGDPIDAYFWLAYTREVGLKGVSGAAQAYLLADKPAAASYHPAPAFRFASAGGAPTVVRSGAGHYTVTLPGMPAGGTAQVSAVGPSNAMCQLSSVATSLPQRVAVRCFTPTGAPADSKFYLSYVH